MGRLFATQQQLRNYTGDQSLTVTDRQLRSASLLVGRATRHAVYQINGAGTAADPKIEQALVDATCEVLAHRSDTGVMSDVTLADLGLQSASIGSASYTVADVGRPGTYRVLPFDAHLILDDAGLLGGPATVVG